MNSTDRDVVITGIGLTSPIGRNAEETWDSIKALKRAAGFLRTRLGQELRMRSVPQLHFEHDDSVETGQRMDQLIDKAIGTDQSIEKDTSAGIPDPDIEK